MKNPEYADYTNIDLHLYKDGQQTGIVVHGLKPGQLNSMVLDLPATDGSGQTSNYTFKLKDVATGTFIAQSGFGIDTFGLNLGDPSYNGHYYIAAINDDVGGPGFSFISANLIAL
ncbi:hypothetical protein ACFFGT_05020 [Mucilaginibacter angelicae]|uniref:Uncharacterized protein n=1 Tax=Mucilaginibacter angelicae TaxID=869718 RepID=A0ABV6L1G4_9SPHI